MQKATQSTWKAGFRTTILLATLTGLLVGLGYLLFREVVPARERAAAFALLGGLVGGTAILHEDGIDFVLLEPQALAVAAFVAVPLAGAWTIARLTERWLVRWPRWTWKRRVASLLPAAPWLALVTISAASLAVVAIAAGIVRVEWTHRPAVVRTVVVASRLALAVVAVAAAVLLVRDVRGIL